MSVKRWNIPAMMASLVQQAFPVPTDMHLETKKDGRLRLWQRYGKRDYLLATLGADERTIKLTRRGERLLAYRYLNENMRDAIITAYKLEAVHR